MRLLTLRAVLVATELDDPAFPGIRTGAELATAAGAALHVVSVVGPAPDPDTENRASAAIGGALARFGGEHGDATVHVLAGEPARAIRMLADRIPANVIVLGRHRGNRSATRSIGGTALAVVTNASSPCLIVPRQFRLPLHHAVVPVDLSDTARGALLVGLSWASALRQRRHSVGNGDATLTAVHVTSSPGAEPAAIPRAIERELALVREAGGSWAGVSIRGDTVTDASAVHGITSYIQTHSPDLVVMGTRGLGLDATGRFGSVAASVSASIDTPTLLVPPAVWMEHAAGR